MGYTDREMTAFTQVAYADFGDCYDYLKARNPGRESFSIEEMLSVAHKTNMSEKEVKQLHGQVSSLTESQKQQWKIVSPPHDRNDKNGFYACIIETSPGEAVVAFRGSESVEDINQLVNDWFKADAGLLNSTLTNQHAEVHRFFEEHKDILDDYNLTMTGHSLGGNLAEYSTIVSSEYGLDDNIVRCVSLDGPGFSDEFIAKYRKQIEKMSNRMEHSRYSLVGSLLNDLPGVHYRYIKVENKEGLADYNFITRHDTRYIKYGGEDGSSYIIGEQDSVSKITSRISQGADHLPSIIGDITITVTCSMIYTYMWFNQNCFDENGNLNLKGNLFIAVAIGAVIKIGVVATIGIVFSVVVGILAVIAIAFVTDFIFDGISTIVNYICEKISSAYNWAKETFINFRDTVFAYVNKFIESVKNFINRGYSYATDNPNIFVDTANLEKYASRLTNVNRRIRSVDRRLDSLYFDVGIKNLWNLVQADALTDYSFRLNQCINYLTHTASDFKTAENAIKNKA